MKGLSKVLLILASAAMATATFARPPTCEDPNFPPGKSKKPSKITILHCGCPDEGDLMYFKEIQVSSKSKGHTRHVIGSIDSCSDGSDEYRDFVRTSSDCQVVEDDSELVGDWVACGDRLAGDMCGSIGGDG